jgi:hypothetical protein
MSYRARERRNPASGPDPMRRVTDGWLRCSSRAAETWGQRRLGPAIHHFDHDMKPNCVDVTSMGTSPANGAQDTACDPLQCAPTRRSGGERPFFDRSRGSFRPEHFRRLAPVRTSPDSAPKHLVALRESPLAAPVPDSQRCLFLLLSGIRAYFLTPAHEGLPNFALEAHRRAYPLLPSPDDCHG